MLAEAQRELIALHLQAAGSLSRLQVLDGVFDRFLCHVLSVCQARKALQLPATFQPTYMQVSSTLL